LSVPFSGDNLCSTGREYSRRTKFSERFRKHHITHLNALAVCVLGSYPRQLRNVCPWQLSGSYGSRQLRTSLRRNPITTLVSPAKFFIATCCAKIATLLLHEGALDHILAQIVFTGFTKPHLVEYCGKTSQHARTTAQHESIILRVQGWHADVLDQLP